MPTVFYVTARLQGEKKGRVDVAKFPVEADAHTHMGKLAGFTGLSIEPREEALPKEWATKGTS